jgi:hypothetical protein
MNAFTPYCPLIDEARDMPFTNAKVLCPHISAIDKGKLGGE